jgi:hypothetical protein
MSRYDHLIHRSKGVKEDKIPNVKINSIQEIKESPVGKRDVERPKDALKGSEPPNGVTKSETLFEPREKEDAVTRYAFNAVNPVERVVLQALRDLTPPLTKAALEQCMYRWRWCGTDSEAWKFAAADRGVSEEDFFPAAQSLLDKGLVEHSPMRTPDVFGIPGGVLPAGWAHIRDCFRDKPYPPPQTKIRRSVRFETRPGITLFRRVRWDSTGDVWGDWRGLNDEA